MLFRSYQKTKTRVAGRRSYWYFNPMRPSHLLAHIRCVSYKAGSPSSASPCVLPTPNTPSSPSGHRPCPSCHGLCPIVRVLVYSRSHQLSDDNQMPLQFWLNTFILVSKASDGYVKRSKMSSSPLESRTFSLAQNCQEYTSYVSHSPDLCSPTYAFLKGQPRHQGYPSICAVKLLGGCTCINRRTTRFRD